MKHPYATECTILKGGKEYFDQFLVLIQKSTEVVHLQVYIFDNDVIGNMVLAELIRARKRGVEIFVVLDGVGSGHLTKDFIRKFADAGIQLRFFSKIYFSLRFRMGRRMHHKLLVVDRNKAIIGGINIADKYRGTETESPWLDYGVYLEGTICDKIDNLARRIVDKGHLKELFTKKARQKETSKIIRHIQILENDFFKRKIEIRRSYISAIQKSEKSIIILASYFLPNARLLKLLQNAVERGVDVKLVLPHKSDVIIYPVAVKYFYGKLIGQGVKIFEYRYSVLHAKVAAADHEWCTIGSYNLNDLSDLLSLELNVEIFEPEIAKDFQKRLEKLISDECVPVLDSYFTKASQFQIWLWKFHYKIMIMLLKITFWLTDKNGTYQVA